MILLIIGLTLWFGVHLIPSLAIPFRERLITALGEKSYKIIFAVLIVGSIVAMVFGWRSIDPVNIYVLPEWSRPITLLLVLITFILFSAAHSTTNIRRIIRHPQLTGLALWSIGHLISNGDNRSLILFGTLGVWAIVEIYLISRREGVWVKPESALIKSELLMLSKGLVMFAVFLFAHPYISGVPVIPQ
ncbi:MAG: NnrU protein [SAR86 cluster bacterium]|uniref:NnrU protein n=1 Tax=SAR86 cluster bacterium TaxID=2030880 RepID=A0A2A5CJB2_9GAMM|nr:NnrU family protein [Gammaproteobacteria bacterium AH-315-E17]PCJ43510.1 MAG: NnrU protein [SAR86 cluster bacterium]